MNSSGFSIIRWQSRGSFVTLRSDLTTGGPMVRLGTKCPSIISTWITLAPPSLAARTCSPRRAKSADRIEGASSIKFVSLDLGSRRKLHQFTILTAGLWGRQRVLPSSDMVAAPQVEPAFYGLAPYLGGG